MDGLRDGGAEISPKNHKKFRRKVYNEGEGLMASDAKKGKEKWGLLFRAVGKSLKITELYSSFPNAERLFLRRLSLKFHNLRENKEVKTVQQLALKKLNCYEN